MPPCLGPCVLPGAEGKSRYTLAHNNIFLVKFAINKCMINRWNMYIN